MKLEFQVNDYLLTWTLLYGASISQRIHTFKQKLWTTYKKQYNRSTNDKGAGKAKQEGEMMLCIHIAGIQKQADYCLTALN